jgi:hypothetical protein
MAKMDVFISWSGQRSRAVAEALKKYLPMIVNDLNPWLSSANIDKGSRSSEEIAVALANARAGIICLTPNNLKEPWILFEAGAIAKTVREKPLACTLLIGLEITDVSGPLSQFQATKLTQPQMLQLVKTLNKALGESAVEERQIEDTFDLCWPKLKETLDNLPTDGPDTQPERRPEDMLKELLELTRQTSLGVLESDRRITEKFDRFENALTLLRWQGIVGSPDQLANLRALLNANPGTFIPSVSNAGFVPAVTTETLAALTLLRQIQPDEVPTPIPPDSPGRTFRRATGLTDLRRKPQAEKK